MVSQLRVPDTVRNRAEELKREEDFATLGEAVRHMCQEGDFNV